MFHELAHWAQAKLNDSGGEITTSEIENSVVSPAPQHPYEMGELVAEMVACFLATELGIPQGQGVENHASYMKTWLAAMSQDSKVINNHVTIGKIEDKGSYCEVCWAKKKVLVRVTFDQQRNGWVCEDQHFRPNEPLPPSQTVRTGIP
jgi:hypothetical protein